MLKSLGFEETKSSTTTTTTTTTMNIMRTTTTATTTTHKLQSKGRSSNPKPDTKKHEFIFGIFEQNSAKL